MPLHRHPTLTQGLAGEGLRKSFSYEPLAGRDDSSSNGDEASPRGGVRFGRRLKSTSMSPLKPSKKSESLSDGSQPEIEPGTGAYLKPESEDDVFVDRVPGDYPPNDDYSERALWPKSPQEFMDSEELALTQLDPADVDAQGIYPPTACIFVANLTLTVRDDHLEAAVTKIFSEYGTVFVKIRRDSRQMPFAFCQFTRDEDAQRAVEEGKGTIIFGRACRTEKAKANSVFIVYRKSGAPIWEEDAFNLLDRLGAISNIEPLDEDLRKEMGLPPAVVVSFKMYDSRRDVVKAVKGQRRFVVLPYEPKKTSVASTPTSSRQHITDSQVQLARYEVDRRSAYFGNLPLDMTEEELQEMAIACGQVLNITLTRKPIPHGLGETVFAFVEYVRPDSVDDIVQSYNKFKLRGREIRVQRKQSRSFDSVPRERSYPASPAPYVPAGSSGRGRYSTSSIRSSRPLVLGSPETGYGPPMRTPVRNPYTTPGQPPSRFSDSSQGSTQGILGSSATFSIVSKRPRYTPARAIPERVSSVRHTIQSSSPAIFHEEVTPKGKGKAPVRPFQLQKTVEPKKQASLPQAKVESDTAAEVKPEDRSKYGHDEDDESASMPEAVVETAREDDANNEDGKPHASEASGNFVPPPLPAAYAMPYGYMPPHISPYGHPAMPYGMPGPYGPNPHPAILNSYMGYPPGFIWSDAYGNPMYTGMAPGMTGPPPRPSIPDPPPTPTRSGGPAPQSRKKSTEPCKDDDEEEEGKGSPK